MTASVGWLAALASTVMFLPQVLRTWRQRHNADELAGVSVVAFSLIMASGALWLVYGALRHDPVIIATNVIMVLTALVTVTIVVRGRAAATRRELDALLDDAELVHH